MKILLWNMKKGVISDGRASGSKLTVRKLIF